MRMVTRDDPILKQIKIEKTEFKPQIKVKTDEKKNKKLKIKSLKLPEQNLLNLNHYHNLNMIVM